MSTQESVESKDKPLGSLKDVVAERVKDTAGAHGLGKADAELVAWLVENFFYGANRPSTTSQSTFFTARNADRAFGLWQVDFSALTESCERHLYRWCGGRYRDRWGGHLRPGRGCGRTPSKDRDGLSKIEPFSKINLRQCGIRLAHQSHDQKPV